MSTETATGKEGADAGTKSSGAKKARMVAVLDIGAIAIHMEIAEIDEQGNVKVVDTLRRPVLLGKDTFSRGRIQQSTIQECVDILKGFRRVMDEYGINSPEQIRAITTSAVREAANRDTFIDRIYIASQINVRVIDEAEESRLIYLSVQNIIENEPDLKNGDAIVADVGGGSTELLLIQQGHVTFSNSFRLGSLRIRETLETQRATAERSRTIMSQHINRLVEQIKNSVPISKAAVLVPVSDDSRFVAAQLLADRQSDPSVRIDNKSFSAFVDKILPLSPEKIVNKYHVGFQDAETLGPALLVYLNLVRAFKTEQILIPKASLRDGLLKEMTFQGYWSGLFAEQVIQSAMTLGEKYKVDARHARQVADLALKLFRELRAEHQLGQRHELLMEAAALLHEVGNFVSSRSHHKHSMYLILNSDLFGLTQDDMSIIALVARYHRRAMPTASHDEYMALSRDDRIAVSKMAAILRVADALDRNHMQNVRHLAFSREKNDFVITVSDIEDLTMERLALKEKGNLFEEVYGMPVSLREERSPSDGDVSNA